MVYKQAWSIKNYRYVWDVSSILVDGCHPYAEDLWKTLKINKLTFECVKLWDRCKVKFCRACVVVVTLQSVSENMNVIYVCFLQFLIQVPTVNQENKTFGTEPSETKVSKQKSTLCCLKHRIYNTSFHLFCHFYQIVSYYPTVWLVRLIYIILCCWQSLCS
jgi:hypothetical protein